MSAPLVGPAECATAVSPWAAFLSREEPRPTFTNRAALAYVCTQVGAGLLALAPGVAHAGWVGVPIIVGCALSAAYTSYLLGWIICQPEVHPTNRNQAPSYEDVGQLTLGRFGRLLTQTLQWLMLVGVSTIFLVLIGVNVAELEIIYGVQLLTKRQVILVAAVLELYPCVFVATVKETFSLTALGALCSATCAVVVVVQAVVTNPAVMLKCLDDDDDANQWSVFTDFQGLVRCWNTVVFGFGGINVLPSLLADFHSRGVLKRALVSFTWRSYLLILVIYVMVAFAGYAVGGAAMASSKVGSNVLTGLTGCPDSTSSVSWALVMAYSVISLHVLLALPVPFHSVVETLEASLGTRERALEPGLKGMMWRAPRLAVLATCTIMAYTLPFFGALLDVVSAISGQGTVFILPVVFAFVFQRQRGLPIRLYEAVMGAICLAVGVCGAVTGLYYGLQELASALKQA